MVRYEVKYFYFNDKREALEFSRKNTGYIRKIKSNTWQVAIQVCLGE